MTAINKYATSYAPRLYKNIGHKPRTIERWYYKRLLEYINGERDFHSVILSKDEDGVLR